MLRIRGSTHFPFRNIHDVLLLQGMIHIHLGEWSRAEQDLERSNNQEICFLVKGNPCSLLKSLIESHQNNHEQALTLLQQASEACQQVQDTLRFKQQLLLHETAIHIYQRQQNMQGAYVHLQQALHICRLHGFRFAEQKIVQAWHKRTIKLSRPSFALPELELNQLIYSWFSKNNESISSGLEFVKCDSWPRCNNWLASNTKPRIWLKRPCD